jgi:hypothetical protein
MATNTHSVNLLFRQAGTSDRETIRGLLSAAGLHTESIDGGPTHFVLASTGGRIAGVAGLEFYGPDAPQESGNRRDSRRWDDRTGAGTGNTAALSADEYGGEILQATGICRDRPVRDRECCAGRIDRIFIAELFHRRMHDAGIDLRSTC